jgi:tetratricopeptide (TPR) repeat protein
MKVKQILIAGTMLVSVATFAQKDELKALKKIYGKEAPSAEDVASFKSNITKLEAIATEEADKVSANFYKSMTPILEIASLGKTATPEQSNKFISEAAINQLATTLNATLEFEKKSGKKVYTDDIIEKITIYKPVFLNYADALSKEKKFKETAAVLYSIYKLDKTDADKLYMASNYAVSSDNYDDALNYYNELKQINYSGEGTMYYAFNKLTKTEDYFGTSPVQRNLMVKTGQYEKPREEIIPSKRGEIYRNIALILLQKGKNEEAKAALVEARNANPTDTSLLISQLDLLKKLKDNDSYTKTVADALQKTPNDVELLFNLGIIESNANNLVDAEKYYKKTIELDPKYVKGYLNLTELTLRDDDKYVKEMNKLGTSEKDTKRYNVLKSEREANFKKALPPLQKIVELDPSNVEVKKLLLSVYNALDMTNEYKALKAKM